jgi:hypothetical protein
MARWRSRATARGGRTVWTLLRWAIHPASWWFLPIAAADLFPRRRQTLLTEFLGHGDRAANGRWRRRFHSSARGAMVIFFWSAPRDWGGEEPWPPQIIYRHRESHSGHPDLAPAAMPWPTRSSVELLKLSASTCGPQTVAEVSIWALHRSLVNGPACKWSVNRERVMEAGLWAQLIGARG